MSIQIRPITPADAPEYNAYRRHIADEPHNTIGLSNGEYTRTIEAEYERIVSALADPDQQILLAITDDGISGQCMCRGSDRKALRHIVVLGIDVAQPYRGMGIGSALMRNMIGWATENPRLSRIELDVFATNRPAISLYLKHGFVIEGCKRSAYFKDGAFIDSYIMGLLLNESLL